MIFRQLLFIALTLLFLSCQEQQANRVTAEKYLKEQRYEEALEEISKLIGQEPDSITHYDLRVLVYRNLGMLCEEIEDLNKIIVLKGAGKSIEVRHGRAIAFIGLGENEKALEDLNYVIDNMEKGGDISQAYIQKASVLYKIKDLKNSKVFYNKALEANDNKDSAITSQAFIGLSNLSSSPKEAMRLLNRAIEIDPERGSAYGARGVLFLKQDNVEGALKDFQKAKKYDSYNSDIYFNIGQLYANYTNEVDSAIYYCEKAIELAPQAPNNDFIHTNLGVLKLRSGKLNEALSHFEIAEKLNSKNGLLLFNYSMLLSDMGRETEALEKINKAIEIDPKDPAYYNLKGTLIGLSDFKGAEQAFLTAISLSPNHGEAFYNLGYINGEKNNIREAIRFYDKAVKLGFDLPATLVNRALLKIKINKSNEACADLKRAFKLGRTDIKPLIERQCL